MYGLTPAAWAMACSSSLARSSCSCLRRASSLAASLRGLLLPLPLLLLVPRTPRMPCLLVQKGQPASCTRALQLVKHVLEA